MKLIAALVLLSALAADWSIIRRSDLTVDGTAITLIEGEEKDVPCKHSSGKSHRIKVEPSKTYEFNGFGAHFEFDSTMNVHVDAKELFASIRLMHPSGSNVTLQVFTDTKGGAVLEQFEAGIHGYIKSMGAKGIVRKTAEKTVAGEKWTGARLECTIIDQPCEVSFFWKPVGIGGQMIAFFRIGPDPKATEKAFATIERSLRFEPK